LALTVLEVLETLALEVIVNNSDINIIDNILMYDLI
jgi:hypothetical protein